MPRRQGENKKTDRKKVHIVEDHNHGIGLPQNALTSRMWYFRVIARLVYSSLNTRTEAVCFFISVLLTRKYHVLSFLKFLSSR